MALVGARTRSCHNMFGLAMARAPVVAAKVPATLLSVPTRPFRNLRRVRARPEVHPSLEQPGDTLEYEEMRTIDEPTMSVAVASTPIPETSWAAAGVGLELLREGAAEDKLDLAVAGPLSSGVGAEAVSAERQSPSREQKGTIRRGTVHVTGLDQRRTQRGTAQPASDNEGADGSSGSTPANCWTQAASAAGGKGGKAIRRAAVGATAASWRDGAGRGGRGRGGAACCDARSGGAARSGAAGSGAIRGGPVRGCGELTLESSSVALQAS